MIEADTRLRELAGIALRALPQMHDKSSGLFSQKAVLRDGGLENRGVNPYYSAASLVGILSQRLVPADGVIALEGALDAVYAAAAADDGRGPLLATALWAGALAEDSRASGLVAAIERSLAIEAAESATLGQTIKGLVAGATIFPQVRDRALALARRCATELLGRHSARSGLFRSMPRRPSGVRSALSARVTSFASQVYPLLGLAALQAELGEAPPPALRSTAERLVRAQGPLGQWWWLYAPGDATVLEGYPVYSVHQDGMAFMGLVPVEELGEGSYREALWRGVEWIDERNELGIALSGEKPPFICRNIQRVGSDADASYGIGRGNLARLVARSWLPSAAGDGTAAEPAQLEPLRECRSYHLGWLLYAYALVAV